MYVLVIRPYVSSLMYYEDAIRPYFTTEETLMKNRNIYRKT